MSDGIANVESMEVLGADTQVIESCLDRICMSAEFARSGRSKELLRFVVSRSLSGETDALTERQIASALLGDRDDWDPKLDPTIRITAGKVRTRLEQYYERNGKNDAIRIQLPKGAYKPLFLPVRPIEVREGPVSSNISPPAATDNGSNVRSRIHIIGGIGVFVLVVIIAAIWLKMNRKLNAGQENYTTEVFAGEIGREFSPSISPDGRAIAFVWDGNSYNYDIYTKDRDGKNLRRLTDSPDPDLSPVWSPDGKSLAFLRLSGTQAFIVVKPVTGGPERTVTSMRYVGGQWTGTTTPIIDNIGPAWSPDGKRLVYSDLVNRGLFEVDLADGKSRRITKPYDLTKDLRDFFPRYSPNGRYIAYAHYVSHGAGDLFTIDLQTNEVKSLTHDHGVVGGLSWMPDSQRLVFASNRTGRLSRLWIIDANGMNVPRLYPSDSSNASEPAVGTDGKWVAYVDSEENWNLWRSAIDHDGLQRAALFLPTSGRNHNPVYSPDGRLIAFISDRSGSWEIWTADADGSNPAQHTHFGGPWIGGISWSPDSKSFAFDVRDHGNSDIHLLRLSGNVEQPLMNNAFEERDPTWSQDGRFVYFNSTRNGSIALYRYDLATKEVSSSFLNTFAAQEAPGEDLIFLSRVGGGFDRVRRDGSPLPPLPQIISPPLANWTVTQAGLYFSAALRVGEPIHIYRYKSEQLTNLGTTPRELVDASPNITVSPDGRWMIVAQVDHLSSDIKIRQAY
jgi:Tol biopolymer transport system component